jgi:AcrR family transcriptional regulator
VTLAVIGRLPSDVRLTATNAVRKAVRRELAAQVAVDAARVDEEISVDILRHSLTQPGHRPLDRSPETALSLLGFADADTGAGACYTKHVAPLLSSKDRRLRSILERAARLIYLHGFEATSMQEIADASGLTKAGLYHHVPTKDALLLAIMHYGMDLFEEQVLNPVVAIADPLARLRETMARNVALVTDDSNKEVTIILHEHRTLTGEARKAINARKKKYVRFLEATFREAIERGQIRAVDPKLAAFSFLGTVLWTYKWYRADGALDPSQLSAGMIDLFFAGLLPR